MAVSGLDVSRWNLFRAATGAAIATIACGPVIGAPEGETEDLTSETDPSGPSDTSDPTIDPTIDPTQGECVEDEDCGYGYACINNFCEYNCYCGCGSQPPPPGSQLRCSEGPGYECYSEYDCDADEDCVYGWCEPAPSDCSDIPVRATSTEIVFSEGPEVVSGVQLVDVLPDPGAELFVSRGNRIERASNSAPTAIIAETTGEILAFALGDVTGDLVVDLVTAEDGDAAMLRLWEGTVDGFVATELARPLVGANALFVADRDADGVDEVYAHVGRDLVVFPTTNGVPLGEGVVLLESRVDEVAPVDAKGDGEVEFMFADGSAVWIYRELQSPEPDLLYEGGQLWGPIVVADFSGDVEPDAAVFGDPAQQITFLGEVGGTSAFAERSIPQNGSSATDIDGDGRADLVLLEPGAGSVFVRFGADAGRPGALSVPFRCDTRFAFEGVGHAIAGGDFDGDGRGELAIADATRVVLVRF